MAAVTDSQMGTRASMRTAQVSLPFSTVGVAASHAGWQPASVSVGVVLTVIRSGAGAAPAMRPRPSASATDVVRAVVMSMGVRVMSTALPTAPGSITEFPEY